MRRVVYMVIGVSLAAGVGVMAHDDFDVDDPIQPGADTQVIEVPGSDGGVNSALIDSYQRALEEAQRRGDPNFVQQLTERKSNSPEPTPASVVPAAGTAELPFAVLEQSLDRDQDGLGDGDEIKLLTDPNNSDSDGDGYGDGIEVVRGYNPLVASPGDKVDYAEPTQFDSDLYKITGIRLGVSGAKEFLTITGTGPNYSLIALLVRGEGSNKLWVTRTDKTGRFIYVSSDTLDQGIYKAYAAAVSADGVTMAASRPLTFDRTADALIKIEPTPAIDSGNEEEIDQLPTAAIMGVAAGGVVVLGAGAGLWLWRQIKQRRRVNPSRLI